MGIIPRDPRKKGTEQKGKEHKNGEKKRKERRTRTKREGRRKTKGRKGKGNRTGGKLSSVGRKVKVVWYSRHTLKTPRLESYDANQPTTPRAKFGKAGNEERRTKSEESICTAHIENREREAKSARKRDKEHWLQGRQRDVGKEPERGRSKRQALERGTGGGQDWRKWIHLHGT